MFEPRILGMHIKIEAIIRSCDSIRADSLKENA
jgi:hypothetical protein